MEVSFKFNAGETGAEMVAAILALFGATQSAPASIALAPADNPAAGADDDAGTPSAATHDTEGMPWDARIHSEKRTTTDKGVWRKRKGVTPGVIAQVTAQIKAAMGTQGTTVTQAGPATLPPTPPAPPAAGMPPLGAPAGLPPMPALVPTETPYTKFVNFVAANMQSATNPGGKFYPEWVSQALAAYGHKDAAGNGAIQALEHATPEAIGAVHAAFATAIGAAV